MKLINTLAIGLLAFAGLTSCEMKDEIKGGKDSSEVGYLELGVSVDAKKNQITKAAENTGTGTVGNNYSADDFPVIITGVTNSEFSKKYNTYKELQAEGAIELPVGNYKIESHSAEELKDVMDQPYFAGSTNLSILKGVKSDATVLCGMLNTKISLSYESQFLAFMQDWTITISDGKHIITYTGTKSNPGTPQPKYVVIAENTSKLIVTVTGTKIDGEKVNESRNITKPTGSNSEYWGAADDLSIKMNINEADVVPGVSGITITVDVTFAESEDTVEIEVTPEEGGGTNPDPETPEEKAEPTVTSPKSSYMLPADKDQNADVTINAEAGIQSVIVQINPGNDVFEGALSLPALKDLLTGMELVDNEDLAKALTAIGIPISAPIKNQKSYIFPVGSFFNLLIDEIGDTTVEKGHEFNITVTDMQGKSKKESLYVVVKGS